MIMMIVMPGYYIILIHYIKATSCGCDAGDGKRPPPRNEDTDNRDTHTSPPPRRGLVARTKGEPHDDDDRGVETNITLVSSACLSQMTEIHLVPSFIPSDKYRLCIKNYGCRRYVKVIVTRVTYI